MSTARVYRDSEGVERSICQMVRLEPEWAANRVQVGEKAIARVSELEALLKEAIDEIKYLEHENAYKSYTYQMSGRVSRLISKAEKYLSDDYQRKEM
jgi:hypothetical protein